MKSSGICVEKCQWEWQAQLIANALTEARVPHDIRSIPREYSSVVTGVIGDNFGIYVDEPQVQVARKIIGEMVPQDSTSPEHSTTQAPITTKNYFRRTIILSLMGIVVLPIVFNVLSVLSYRKLLLQEKSSSRKQIALAFVVLGWIFSFWMVKLFLIDR